MRATLTNNQTRNVFMCHQHTRHTQQTDGHSTADVRVGSHTDRHTAHTHDLIHPTITQGVSDMEKHKLTRHTHIQKKSNTENHYVVLSIISLDSLSTLLVSTKQGSPDGVFPGSVFTFQYSSPLLCFSITSRIWSITSCGSADRNNSLSPSKYSRFSSS
mmetsp:Transcript_11498/g.33371  ORF Transcript_11498/g.33371 Transcript_11498/m.33371 type:complete len:159 (+) Transcript_11498:219-695(+)